MELSEEVKNAAQALGKSLHEDDFMQDYLDAVAKFQADPEAGALVEQLALLHQSLSARQQSGELLTSDDTQEYHKLRRRLQANPSIFQRDNALMLIKPYLVSLADEINTRLGMDFTVLAASEDGC